MEVRFIKKVIIFTFNGHTRNGRLILDSALKEICFFFFTEINNAKERFQVFFFFS